VQIDYLEMLEQELQHQFVRCLGINLRPFAFQNHLGFDAYFIALVLNSNAVPGMKNVLGILRRLTFVIFTVPKYQNFLENASSPVISLPKNIYLQKVKI
jgi:hypothetical protein